MGINNREIPRCDICGIRDAEYVCKGCGRLICRIDFDYTTGLCRLCSEETKIDLEEPVSLKSILMPTLLIFIGLILIFIGFAVMSLSYTGSITNATSDVVVIIGPLPLLLTGNIGLLAAFIYLIIMVVIIFIIFRRFLR